MASRQLYPRVLYFISGTTPTPEQLQDANRYGPGVTFRNASMIVPDAPIEDADAVAGAVPANYADALPGVDDTEAVQQRMDERDPNVQTMFQRERAGVPYDAMTAEQKQAANAAAMSRGARPASVNERLGTPQAVETRITQAGTPRVDTSPQSGWSSPASGGWSTGVAEYEPPEIESDDAKTAAAAKRAAQSPQPSQPPQPPKK